MKAYRVPARTRRERRLQRLADAVALLAERLHRLQDVYLNWRNFQPGSYFDLRPAQELAIIRMERLGATLDVVLYADLLSPAYRDAERYWAKEFCPAYYAAAGPHEDAYSNYYQRRVIPGMQRRLQKAKDEIAEVGNMLYHRGDFGFLSAASAPDEREKHIESLSGDDEDLAMLFHNIPTLTLSRSFDLLEMGQP